MKILHVINSLHTGGAEKLLLETLPRYEKSGIEVDLLLLNGVETSFYESFSVEFMGTIHTLGNKSVYNPLHIIRLRKYLVKYDIVHVHLFPSLYWVALAKLLTRSKTKLVYTEHSISNRRFRSSSTRLMDKFVYSFYNKIIGITQPICDFVGNRFDKADDIILIENGVNIRNIQRKTPLTIDALGKICDVNLSGKKLLLQVSSFHPPKDQLTLIKALNYLPENVILILAGDGVLRESVTRATEDLGLASRVFFIGNYDNVPALLKSADLVLLSSQYEGMSLSSIEGMASGKPFVASDVPGLREVVEGAGILFPYRDEKKLANEISKLLNDKEHYTAVVKSCLERASTYDIHKMVNKHVSLYRKVYLEA